MVKMTIDELIKELEEAREDLGGGSEVRIAYQPNWPLRGTVAAVTVPSDDSAATEAEDNDGGMLWLAVGSAPCEESTYAPRLAWGGEDWS